MFAVRYEAIRKLRDAAEYLIRQYPGARNPMPSEQQDREARYAIRILEALKEIVRWCDYATL